jgi:hypothetical protein
MIKPEQIPDEVWKATGLPEIAARATVAAALNAWESADIQRQPEWEKLGNIPGADVLCLPLPQESRT